MLQPVSNPCIYGFQSNIYQCGAPESWDQLRVHVDLDRFFPASPTALPADRSRIRALDLFIVRRIPSRSRSVVTDMIRFE